MFPISDTAPRRSLPFINYAIIFFTIFIFFRQIASADFEGFIYQYSFIPKQFNFLNPDSYFHILTSIFLHGGFFHLLSNMWFLHIFGDNIEDRFGHIRYLLFYLVAGFFAVITQYLLSPSSSIPMIGASGAISGVAGAYFILFRKSAVKTLILLFIVLTVVELPAWFFLGYWFVLQLFTGLGSLVNFDINQGGIAYFAHVGGFVYGFIVAKSWKGRMIV